MSIESVMPSNHLILCGPLLLLPSIFPSIRVFPMSQFFSWGGQSVGASVSASVLPMNIQRWFPLGWTGWLSRVFSITVRKTQCSAFFMVQLSHPNMTTEKTIALTSWTLVNTATWWMLRARQPGLASSCSTLVALPPWWLPRLFPAVIWGAAVPSSHGIHGTSPSPPDGHFQPKASWLLPHPQLLGPEASLWVHQSTFQKRPPTPPPRPGRRWAGPPAGGSWPAARRWALQSVHRQFSPDIQRGKYISPRVAQGPPKPEGSLESHRAHSRPLPLWFLTQELPSLALPRQINSRCRNQPESWLLQEAPLAFPRQMEGPSPHPTQSFFLLCFWLHHAWHMGS